MKLGVLSPVFADYSFEEMLKVEPTASFTGFVREKKRGSMNAA